MIDLRPELLIAGLIVGCALVGAAVDGLMGAGVALVAACIVLTFGLPRG